LKNFFAGKIYQHTAERIKKPAGMWQGGEFKIE
jgi:hypothetical protein